MQPLSEIVSAFVILWAVIDPIGTIPVFVSVTGSHSAAVRRRIALVAALAAAGILLFFIVIGEVLLRAMGVPLMAFQISGGIVLFLFALTMIFGESKPVGETRMIKQGADAAIFPLATPSLASPGAMMAVVLLTENSSHSILQQAVTAGIMLLVMALAYLLMLTADRITHLIGEAGASVISRVMGMILASVAAANVLEGLRLYFS